MGFFSFIQEIAMDLGTANTIIISDDKIVVDEPSVVALDRRTDKMIAVGESENDDEYWDSYDEADDWSSYMLTDEEFEELLLQIKQELPYLTQADIDDYLTFYEEYLTQEQYQELVEALQVTQSL